MKREDEIVQLLKSIREWIICQWLLLVLIVIFLCVIAIKSSHAAEIVYYDDDSCVVVERVCVDSGQGPMLIPPGCSFDGRSFCMTYGFWDSDVCLDFDSTMFLRAYCSKTVTYVRKEAEPKHCHGDSIVSFKGFYSPSWADELDIVANLDSMIAGSCIRIPHDAPTHYFMDTVITKEGCWGFEFCYDTLIDTTFVYEVE